MEMNNLGKTPVEPSADSGESTQVIRDIRFPTKVVERFLSLMDTHKDRNSLSLVCKDWYNADRWTRTHLFIGNCYSVSPEMVTERFLNIRSVTLKGKPRFSDFNLVPDGWGADIQPWLKVFASAYPFLEELRLKRMTVTDESLEFLATNFNEFKALSMLSCQGFSTDGLGAIATHCKNLTELDIQENDMEDLNGDWLTCFPESITSLEVLNFASLCSIVSFNALEKLVSRCQSLRVLKVNKNIGLEQLQELLVWAPQLMELGTGSFQEQVVSCPYAELENAFSNCKKLHTLSGLWEATSLYLPLLYPLCATLTFLNLSYATLDSDDFSMLVVHCPCLRRLWVLDTLGDEGLEAVGSSCPLLEELRVFPADPFEDQVDRGVTESGFVAVSRGCPRLRYVLYFCHQMTNAAVATIVQNCPNFTHFRLCVMEPGKPDYLTGEPMDEAFGAVVKTCSKLRRLSVSGLLTDKTFEYIGKHAKNLETLSVAFAGTSDWGMQCLMGGCPKLKKLEIRDFAHLGMQLCFQGWRSMNLCGLYGCQPVALLWMDVGC